MLIFLLFLFTLSGAYVCHRRKLRATKEQMDDFIKRFNIGDPEGLVSSLIKLKNDTSPI